MSTPFHGILKSQANALRAISKSIDDAAKADNDHKIRDLVRKFEKRFDTLEKAPERLKALETRVKDLEKVFGKYQAAQGVFAARPAPRPKAAAPDKPDSDSA